MWSVTAIAPSPSRLGRREQAPRRASRSLASGRCACAGRHRSARAPGPPSQARSRAGGEQPARRPPRAHRRRAPTTAPSASRPRPAQPPCQPGIGNEPRELRSERVDVAGLKQQSALAPRRAPPRRRAARQRPDRAGADRRQRETGRRSAPADANTTTSALASSAAARPAPPAARSARARAGRRAAAPGSRSRAPPSTVASQSRAGQTAQRAQEGAKRRALLVLDEGDPQSRGSPATARAVTPAPRHDHAVVGREMRVHQRSAVAA